MTSKQEIANDALKHALNATTCEVHLQQYPIFCLQPQRATDNQITFIEQVRQGRTRMTRQWSVTIQPACGWPGEHEAELWRSIEHILHLRNQEGRLKNPLVTTFSELREHMMGTGKGGTNIQRIKASLDCLQGTSVSADFFYHSDTKINAGVRFSLISSITYRYKDRIVPSGERYYIDFVDIGFDPKLFTNIQQRYVRPLDKGLRDQLKRWISKRLYELLGVKFFALRNLRAPYRTGYLRLCALIGIVPQRHLSKANQVLGRAHTELQLKGFIAKVEWLPTATQGDWILQYWPGELAKAEWKKQHWLREKPAIAPLIVEELEPISETPVLVNQLDADEAANVIDISSEEVQEADSPPTQRSSKTPQKARRGASKGEPKLSPAYIEEALCAFERATTRPRRLKGLSPAERDLLTEWQSQGITAADIEYGIRLTVQRTLKQAREAGRPPSEIWSIDYCRADVEACIAERRELEALQRQEQARCRQVYEQAIQARDANPTLVALERQFKQRMLDILPDEILSTLVIWHPQRAGSLSLLAPDEEIAYHARSAAKLLANAWGEPVHVMQP